MKKLKFQVINVLLLCILLINNTYGQETIFTINNCGYNNGFAVECTYGGTQMPIEVSGVGTMGEDNYGIVEVFVDIEQPNFFEGKIILQSPDGQEFILADTDDGIQSFPEYSGINNGEILNVYFRNCPSLPEVDSQIEPSGVTFYPLESFTFLNDGATSGDGTWFVKFCTTDPNEYIQIFCASVTFGAICPDINNVIVTPASCSGTNDAAIEIVANEGACPDESIVYSINGTDFVSSPIFTNLAPGNYTASVGYEAEVSFHGSVVPVCVTEFDFTIGFEDLIAPTWEVDQVIVNVECGVDDDIELVVQENLQNLIATDNCSTTFIEFSYNEVTPQCGNSEWNDWIYTVSDEQGNVALETGKILINVNDLTPPSLSGIPANITINCQDDFPDLPVIGAGGITANDLCQGDVTSLITQSSSLDFGDCALGQPTEIHTYSYEVIDGCGNLAIESFTVSVFNDAAPSINLPFVANETYTLDIECGVDDLQTTIDLNIPTAIGCNGSIQAVLSGENASDNCGGGSGTSSHSYIYTFTDECNNQAQTTLTINIVDTQAPLINGVPADLTLNCNDSYPTFPQITASDICEGDVTDLIDYTMTESALSCNYNENALVETHTWTVLDYCGNMQTASWKITLFNDEEVDLGDDIVACVGEAVNIASSGLSGTYAWSTGETSESITVNSAGSYMVTVTGVSGCCSIDEIVVSYQNSPDASATGGTLDCSGSGITIMGNSTTSGVSYAWEGPGGFTSNEQNPVVTQEGTYILTVSTSAGCMMTATAEVDADIDAPDITTEGATIDCNNSSVTISGSSTTDGVSFEWSGPNGYTSTEQNPTVNNPGDYNLTITAPNGCVAAGIAVVEDDTMVPSISITNGAIDCNNDEITLTTTSSDQDASFLWSGPNGYSSTEMNPMVTTAGSYFLTITSDNGCSNMASTNVDEDIAIPNLSASGGAIDCTDEEVQITATSTTTGVIYQWIGPNGFSSDLPSPIVDVAGVYTITVESLNGCTASMDVTVTMDSSSPTLSIEDAEINCNNTTVTLMANTSDNVTFEWTGPGGFSSDEESPSVNIAGVYSLTITAANGCIASESSTVTEDTSDPVINTSDGMINCNNPITQLQLTATDNDLTFAWTGPSGFTSDEQNPEVTLPGNYVVIASAENGCTTSESVSIVQDIAVPDATAIGGEISCNENSVQLQGSSTTAGVSYSWEGPNDFTSDTQNPEVGSPGTYTLIVTGANGCTSTATAEVSADANLPNISATGGTINCIIDEVELTASSTTAGVSYNWIGPGGLNTDEQNPVVSDAGVYTLIVTAINGCKSEIQVSVTLDNTIPPVIALGGQLSCTNTSVILLANSTNDVSYAWTGPGGFTSDEQNPSVSVAGEYTLVVTAENGCTNTETVTVEANEDLPVATLLDPQIDCDNNEITLTVESEGDHNYAWTLEGALISTGSFVQIDEAGLYTVEVTAPNGCSIMFSYELEEDIEDVEASITTQSASSGSNGSATIAFTNTQNIATIEWDNGDTGNEANNLSPGIHTVLVTTELGCVFTFEFEILLNTDITDIEILEDFKVYPTIFQDHITIEANLSESAESRIIIYNNSGQLLFEEILPSTATIDRQLYLGELSSGIYILSVHINGKIKTSKLIKS